MSPKLEFRPLEFPSLNEAERAALGLYFSPGPDQGRPVPGHEDLCVAAANYRLLVDQAMEWNRTKRSTEAEKIAAVREACANGRAVDPAVALEVLRLCVLAREGRETSLPRPTPVVEAFAAAMLERGSQAAGLSSTTIRLGGIAISPAELIMALGLQDYAQRRPDVKMSAEEYAGLFHSERQSRRRRGKKAPTSLAIRGLQRVLQDAPGITAEGLRDRLAADHRLVYDDEDIELRAKGEDIVVKDLKTRKVETIKRGNQRVYLERARRNNIR
jgi:hypothetical protein